MTGNEKGSDGENKACEFLQKRGYIIRERNYHSRYGEIDIIAEKDGFIAFVEVKRRKKNSRVSPFEAVSYAKQKKIISTALLYLQENDSLLQPRFDVISLTDYEDGECKTEHIEAAFNSQDFSF